MEFAAGLILHKNYQYMHKFASHYHDLSMLISRLPRVRDGTNQFMIPDSGNLNQIITLRQKERGFM